MYEITGFYTDAGFVIHDFVRDNKGNMTSFDPAGAGGSPGQGTFATSINAAGEITGSYIDAGDVRHGFVRGK